MGLFDTAATGGELRSGHVTRPHAHLTILFLEGERKITLATSHSPRAKNDFHAKGRGGGKGGKGSKRSYDEYSGG